MEKEEIIRAIARRYYSRRDIQEAIVSQSRNREVVPRYYEGFGKRPDTIEYESDVYNLAAKGATSFHCSEEIWSDPLEISTSMPEEQIKKLRTGWDLIIDIDCKFPEYGKIAAFLLSEAFYFHNLRNFGLKFSGGSGFHLGVSFKAFPKMINGIKIREFFPEGPRMIAAYLKDMISKDLASRILEMSTMNEIIQASGKQKDYFMKKKCRTCGKAPERRVLRTEIKKKSKETEDLICPKCGASYSENKNDFVVYEEFDPYSILEIDTVLISSRHLYRAAYSLNEKTGLSSIVIKPDQIKAFHPAWAKPERVFPRQFMPEPEPEEAKELLLRAYDWHAKNEEKKEIKEELKKSERKPINIGKISDDIFPPCVKSILKGVKNDGRKRALFILINFFKSLNLDSDEIEKRVKEWNKLNYKPLKENYITTQIQWFKRQGQRLPPNCSLAVYNKDIGACAPDFLCRRIKNPVNYAVLKAKTPGQKKPSRTKVF